MKKSPLVIIGCGGHAISCIDVIEQENKFEIVGLIGCAGTNDGGIYRYPMIGFDNELESLVRSYPNAFIGIGQIKSSHARYEFYEKLISIGYELPTIISPSAYVSPHAEVGKGSIVMHGAIINAGAIVGKNCIINSKALIEHGAIVGDHCHISTGSKVNGDVRIGYGSFIGSSACIKEGAYIGNNCIVGMGLAVRHNLPDNTLFVG